jgi:hypothetical protein
MVTVWLSGSTSGVLRSLPGVDVFLFLTPAATFFSLIPAQARSSSASQAQNLEAQCAKPVLD